MLAPPRGGARILGLEEVDGIPVNDTDTGPDAAEAAMRCHQSRGAESTPEVIASLRLVGVTGSSRPTQASRTESGASPGGHVMILTRLAGAIHLR